MLSMQSTSVVVFVFRQRLVTSMQWRYRRPLTTTITTTSRLHVRNQPNNNNNNIGSTRRTRRRYLSSENKEGSTSSIEECARSITRAISNQQLVPQGGATTTFSEPAMELARKLSPEARREIVRATAATTASSSSSSSTSSSSPQAGTAAPAAAAAAAAATSQQAVEVVPPPSYRDLRLVALAQAIPFLGFGFMDNAILIIAGDAIDTSLGVVLGISTLCAAAIGNIISDVAGIALGTVIEDFCTNYLKIPMPNLTNAQRQLRSVRFASQMGCGVGIVVGCIIGMFPLLFIDTNKVQQMKRDAALQSLFDDVMSEAKTLIGAESASLFIVVENDPEESDDPPVPNPEGRYLYAKYFHSDSGEVSHKSFKIGRGIVSRAALTGRAWNIHDVNSEPDFSPELSGRGQNAKTMCCVPVLDSQGKTIAVIRAFNKIAEGSIGAGDATNNNAPPAAASANDEKDSPSIPRVFTHSDIQVLKALASHISVTLQYMYQERDEDAAMGVKDSIRLLKEHGLAGIPDEPSAFTRRPPLFPDQ